MSELTYIGKPAKSKTSELIKFIENNPDTYKQYPGLFIEEKKYPLTLHDRPYQYGSGVINYINNYFPLAEQYANVEFNIELEDEEKTTKSANKK